MFLPLMICLVMDLTILIHPFIQLLRTNSQMILSQLFHTKRASNSFIILRVLSERITSKLFLDNTSLSTLKLQLYILNLNHLLRPILKRTYLRNITRELVPLIGMLGYINQVLLQFILISQLSFLMRVLNWLINILSLQVNHLQPISKIISVSTTVPWEQSSLIDLMQDLMMLLLMLWKRLMLITVSLKLRTQNASKLGYH